MFEPLVVPKIPVTHQFRLLACVTPAVRPAVSVTQLVKVVSTSKQYRPCNLAVVTSHDSRASTVNILVAVAIVNAVGVTDGTEPFADAFAFLKPALPDRFGSGLSQRVLVLAISTNGNLVATRRLYEDRASGRLDARPGLDFIIETIHRFPRSVTAIQGSPLRS